MAIQEIKVDKTCYRFEGITVEEAKRLQTEVLTDPVTQTSELNPVRPNDEIETGYKPGVTDPIALSLNKAAELIGIQPPKAVSSSRISKGVASVPSQIEEIITQGPKTLINEGISPQLEHVCVRELEDDELIALSKARSLFLNLEEMQVISAYYRGLGREPTDVEIEMIAQTWSEHCAHKTFKAILVDERGEEKEPLFSRIKNASEKQFERLGVVTAFKDNAGGMIFYDGEVTIGKGETHNSPVAIEPYAGSLTKNGGLYRDIAGTGQGGVNLVGFMINNFAPPNTLSGDVKPGCLHPKHLLLQNSRGERDYGNPMGIPTHSVNLHFHPDFGQKPTSLGVAIGIIPESRVEKGIPQNGDLIVAVGGKTGRDGIHGATFSSGGMTYNTKDVHSTAVQLGDPIVERTMFDALIACREANLIRAITDCGAGGFSSAIGEMANGIGAKVQLDKILTKYKGLAPWEIWLSESQERMVVAIAPDDLEEFQMLCARYDTNAIAIGNFTNDNTITIFNDTELVGQIDLGFLHEGLPQRKMQMVNEVNHINASEPVIPQDFLEVYKSVVSHLNVCSKEEMHRMYDMTVQGTTVMSPWVGKFQDIPSEASVLAPIPGAKYGLVTTHAVNPILNRIDPYWGSIWAYTHAATRYVAAGGDITQACGIDNYISPSPNPKALADLDKMTDGLCEMIDIIGVPMVSGKDSLSSTYKGSDGEVINAPPSLNITIFGKIPDYEKTVTPDFKRPGSTICIVGNLDITAMGGSVYFDTQGIENSNIPKIDKKNIRKVLCSVKEGIDTGIIKSARAIGEGGIALALAQMCIGGDCGADVELQSLGGDRLDFALFNETAGCVVVEVEDDVKAHDFFGDEIPYKIIGNTTNTREISVWGLGNFDLDDLKDAWKAPMKEILS